MNYVYLPEIKRTIFLDHIQKIAWHTPMISFSDGSSQKISVNDAHVLAETLETPEEAFLPYDDESEEHF